MKKNRLLIAGLAAMAAAAMIGGTWAVWTQRLSTGNEFMTAKYSTFLKEEFTPPEGWLPGEEERKAVWVENDSTIPIIAKITMDQKWLRREDITALQQTEPNGIPEETVVSKAGELLPLIFEGESGGEKRREYAALLNFTPGAVVVLSGSRTKEPGLRLAGIEEVSTLEEAKGRWLLVSETPDEEGHFTFYYMGMVQPGEKTPVLLSGVTMNPMLETTVTGSHTYFIEDPEAQGGYRKVTVDTVNSKYGYDSSHYTLNVNMQTVQATKDAVEAIFPKDQITEYIAGYIAGDGVFESTSVKKLYFEESSGKMMYTPYRTADGGVEEGNWFMSFTNMVPGGIYKDKLLIENGSPDAYSVYMRIIPRENQTELQDELLKKIFMKIYYRDQLLYDGDATGYHYSSANGEQDMQGLVPLGYFGRGSKEEIRVELILDPNLGLKDDGTYQYADVLTKIDWEFMVQLSPGSNRPGGGGSSGGGGGGGGGRSRISDDPVPAGGLTTIGDDDVPLSMIPDPEVPLASMIPKTGDDFPIIPLAVTAVISILLAALFGMLGFGKKKKEAA